MKTMQIVSCSELMANQEPINNYNKSSEGLYRDLGSSTVEGLGLNEMLREHEMKLCHLTYHD